MITTRIDDKGRIVIPAEIRQALGLTSGDVMFLDIEDNALRVARVTNPIDHLIVEALRELENGHTQSLRDFASDQGFE